MEGVVRLMEDSKVFEAFYDLPDGYQVQLMVLQDFPGGRQKRGLRMNIYRTRIWVGHESEPEPLLHRSQEHTDVQLAVDACYSLLLASARFTVNSPDAVAAIERQVDHYFCGKAKAM